MSSPGISVVNDNPSKDILKQYLAGSNLGEGWWENFLRYPTPPPQVPSVQYFIPISIYASVVGALSPDINHIIVRLNRHEDLLQDIYETVKVIEVETRRLNPDPIDDLVDAAEAELGDILNTVKEKRFPSPPSQEIEAMLAKAIERKRSNTQSAEGLVSR